MTVEHKRRTLKEILDSGQLPKRHPLSQQYGDMTEKEFASLGDSLEKHIKDDPVVWLDGQILDGWHRYLYCREIYSRKNGSSAEAKKMLHGRQFDPEADGDPADFAEARNLNRRHYTTADLAFIGARRVRTTGGESGRPKTGNISSFLTHEQAASKYRVSQRYIQMARRILDEAPELEARVRIREENDLSLSAAFKELNPPKPESPVDESSQSLSQDDQEAAVKELAERQAKDPRPKPPPKEKPPRPSDPKPAAPRGEAKPITQEQVDASISQIESDHRKQAADEDPDSTPEAPKSQTVREQLAEAKLLLASTQDALESKARQNGELEERIRLMEALEQGDNKRLLQRLTNVEAELKAARSQVQTWQGKHREAESARKAVERKLAEADARLKELGEGGDEKAPF